MCVLSILQKLNKSCCESKNCFGIQMGTKDNQGWYVFIDLFDTIYETKDFQAIEVHVGDENWINCTKENNVFKGFGGVENLEDILHIFCEWATS